MSHAKASKGDILIVDDEPTNLKVLTSILARQGYQVRPAINGQLALRAARKTPPDLILLDILMPDIRGYEVCEQLKADPETDDIPIIFISALGETQDKVRAFAAGGIDYVTKPFQEEEVLARVETHLALQAMRKELEREIAERKRVESVLRESEERYRSIVENSHAGIMIFDNAFHFVYANERICYILGYPHAEIVGQDFRLFLDKEHRDSVLDHYFRLLSGVEDPLQVEFDIVRKDGEKRRVEAIATLIHDSAGTAQCVGQLLDITERWRAEEGRKKLISELESTLAQVKTLSGLLPICASCKKIRDDKGYWTQVEVYVREHSEVEFSHGLCPDCQLDLFPPAQYPFLYEDGGPPRK